MAGLPSSSYGLDITVSQPQPSQAAQSSRAEYFSQLLPPKILDASQRTIGLKLGSSAASLANDENPFMSSCKPVDDLINNGLFCGQMLELSGPPGSAKEHIAVQFARQAILMGKGVLYTVSQNMTRPSSLRDTLGDVDTSLLHYHQIHTLTGLLAMLRSLPLYLGEHSSIRLLVFESIWFHFQETSSLSRSARAGLLAKIKQDLVRLCAERRVAIITTTQLATKLVHADGTSANFETGVKAILAPQLSTAYLHLSRAYRVIIVPETRTTGVVRLLSSPSHNHENGDSVRETSYAISKEGMLSYPQTI